MSLDCYRCGSSLAELSLPLSRLDTCPGCRAELHVCRMCVHFAPSRAPRCANDDAEEVRDASKANFCDYFTPSAEAYTRAQRGAEAEAAAALESLFGESAGGSEPEGRDGLSKQDELARRQAEALFKK